MENDKLQLLIGHYSESFDLLQGKLKERNRLFIGVLFILAIILFQIYAPKGALSIMSLFIKNQLGELPAMNFYFIDSIIWFILLSVTLRYFQVVVYIERQYKYVHQLEKEISPSFNEQAFTREGLLYLKNYPKFLKWVYFLYTMFFPFLLAVIVISKLISEYDIRGGLSTLFWFNVLIGFFILISTFLYFIVMHFKNK